MQKFQLAGAQVIVISPEKSEFIAKSAKKTSPPFPILSDPGNKVAKKYGLVFELSPQLTMLYKKFGIDLTKFNGTKKFELPLTPTLVIDGQGVVRYAFYDEDYTKRAEPFDILFHLGQKKKK